MGRKQRASPPIAWWPYAAAVAAITFVAFTPALQGDFLSWDDWSNFVQNHRYRGLGPENLQWMWTTTLMGHYIPLTWMSFGLDYTLWGMNPLGYHLVSILIHCVDAVLLFFVARRLFALAHVGERPGGRTTFLAAAFAALFYAVHPLRVESVAWITERRDVLSLMFYLGAMLAYLRALEARERFRSQYALAIGLFACAVLAKGVAVTFPAALLLVNVYPLKRLGGAAGWTSSSARRVYVELAPFGMIGVFAGILSVQALPAVTPLLPGQKVAASVFSLGFYYWKTVAPLGLSPLYEMPVRFDAFAARFVFAYAVAAAFLVIGMGSIRRWPGVATTILGFVLLSLPLLGAVQNGPQISADRYTYQSGIALALLAGGLVTSSLIRSWRLPIVVGVVAILAALTWRQSLLWRSSESLWARVLETDSTSSYAYNNIGAILADQGKRSDAIRFYEKAVALRPDFPAAHNNWGFDLAALGDTASAIVHFETALTQRPDFAEAEINLGNIFAHRQQYAEAIARYSRAVRADPTLSGAQLNWALALERQGKIVEAVPHYESAVTLDPSDPDAAAGLARARLALRSTQGAR